MEADGIGYVGDSLLARDAGFLIITTNSQRTQRLVGRNRRDVGSFEFRLIY